MSKPKAPAPPDPKATAAAQTSQSLGTAIANTQLGQVNQVTPDGSLNYSQTGTYAWTDPNSGKVYNLPQYTATTTLSADAQALRDASNRGNLALANLGADQAGRLGDILSRTIDTSSLPRGADRSGDRPVDYGADLSAPQYSQQGSNLPQYAQGTNLPTLNGIDSTAGLKTGYQNDFSADRAKVEDALLQRLNPQLDRSRQQLETSLANRGIKLGSAAYDRALEESNKAANDARYGAILNAGQEQSRLAGLARDEAMFGNSALQQELQNRTAATQYGNTNAQTQYNLAEDQRRYGNTLQDQTYAMNEDQRRYGDAMASQGFADRQAIQGRADANKNNQFNQRQAIADALDNQRTRSMQEQFAIQDHPLNQIAALLGAGQVATPQFSMAQPSQMQTTDIASLLQNDYNNRLSAYGMKQQANSDVMGGLFGIGKAAIMASDRRFKKDIRKVGKADGHNIYAYRYQNEDSDAPEHVGVMAQEVEKTRPDAVIDTPIGKAVNYTKLFGLGTGLGGTSELDAA